MATKTYFMINMRKGVDREGYLNALGELEALPEVRSVEPIDGICDLLVTAEAPIRAIFVANKISAMDWVKRLRMLKVVPFAHVRTPRQEADIEALKRWFAFEDRMEAKELEKQGLSPAFGW